MLQNTVIERIFNYIDNIYDVYKFILVSKNILNVFKQLDINILLKKIKNKQQKLIFYINFYKHLPKQGSAEWIKSKNGGNIKPPTIGGSEMYDFIHSTGSFAFRKIFQTGIEPNIHLLWGNIFEEVIANIFDCIFKTDDFVMGESIEMGSIPGIKFNNEHVQSYSPDRIMYISKQQLLNVVFSNFNSADIKLFEHNKEYICDNMPNKLIVLNEFKCPTVRIPKGDLYFKYKYQPQTGMHTIPVIDISLFADNVFRKCSINDFKFNTDYDKYFHVKDFVNNVNGFNLPLALGYIGIYEIPININKIGSDQNQENQKNQELESKSQELKITSELINLLAHELKDLILPEINKKGSVYYGLELHIKNITSIISLCDKFILLLYNTVNVKHGININDYNITATDEETVVFNCVKSIINIPENMLDLVKYIIPDTLTLNYKNRVNVSTDFGLDLGKSTEKELLEIFKKVQESKHNNTGYKIYYNPCIHFKNDLYNELNITPKNIAENYIDVTVPEETKYINSLYTNIGIFTKFCNKNNYKPIGVLPWKLFNCCIVPVFKDNDFLNKHKDNIFDFVSKVQKIKQNTITKYGDIKKDSKRAEKFVKQQIKTEFVKTYNQMQKPTKNKPKVNRKKSATLADLLLLQNSIGDSPSKTELSSDSDISENNSPFKSNDFKSKYSRLDQSILNNDTNNEKIVLDQDTINSFLV